MAEIKQVTVDLANENLLQDSTYKKTVVIPFFLKIFKHLSGLSEDKSTISK